MEIYVERVIPSDQAEADLNRRVLYEDNEGRMGAVVKLRQGEGVIYQEDGQIAPLSTDLLLHAERMPGGRLARVLMQPLASAIGSQDLSLASKLCQKTAALLGGEVIDPHNHTVHHGVPLYPDGETAKRGSSLLNPHTRLVVAFSR